MTSSIGPTVNDAWTLSTHDESSILTLSGAWQLKHATELPSAAQLCAAIPLQVQTVTVVLDNVTDGDSLLPALLLSLKIKLALQDTTLTLPALSATTQSLLELSDSPARQKSAIVLEYFWLHHLGLIAIKQWANFLLICSSVFYFLRSVLRALTGKAQFRMSDLFNALNQCTLRALPIISVVSLLLGSILAFVGAIQLRAFGASVYIADTVGIAVAREMAAIMTAIVIAGHTGAAFAAQLASMRVNEEIDAFRTLGLSPHDYLAVPRVLALTLAMPMLYLYAVVMTLLGSMLVANVSLNMSPIAYVGRTIDAVPVTYFALGLVKSLCFGALIGLVSCHIGLHSGRSAEAVGEAATQSVVISILGIIIVDSLFAIASILFEF
ncbi:MAG: ABC transporter permease [Natronospirillum sp.]